MYMNRGWKTDFKKSSLFFNLKSSYLCGILLTRSVLHAICGFRRQICMRGSILFFFELFYFLKQDNIYTFNNCEWKALEPFKTGRRHWIFSFEIFNIQIRHSPSYSLSLMPLFEDIGSDFFHNTENFFDYILQLLSYASGSRKLINVSHRAGYPKVKGK